MIDLRSLRIVDYYQWAGCGRLAAKELGCNQSTVSRKWAEFQWLFAAASISEDLLFVDLERRVHQCWRFAKGVDLRVHMYLWINRLLKEHLPVAWTSNPLELSTTVAPALQLLGDRVIDALCAPYPMIAAVDRDRFALVPLYSTSLVLLARSECLLTKERGLSLRDVELATRPGALGFVPAEVGSCSAKVDQQIFSASGEVESRRDHRYWGTSLSSFNGLKVLDYSLSAPYAEFLVVLKEWQEHAQILSLLQAIGDGLGGRSSRFCESQQLSIHHCL